MLNRFYQTGILIGALPKTDEGSIDRYQTIARRIWANIPDDIPYAIVEVARDGATFATPYKNKEAANDRYGRSTSNPGTSVYIAYFDRRVLPGENPLIDEAFFQPTDIVETRTEKVPFGVKAGLGLGAAIAMIALVAKH